MKLLVLYRLHTWKPQRKAIEDHLLCFERCLPEDQVFYCNVLMGIPSYINWVEFDAIILHSSLLDLGMRVEPYKSLLKEQLSVLKNVKAVKIALPQDEWINTESLWEFFKVAGCESLFTVISRSAAEILYPHDKSGIKHILLSYPGFLDESFIAKAKSLEIQHRDIDIGYRARNMGVLCGRFGQLKHQLVERFLPYQGQYGLKMDLSTDPKDTFYGDEWIRFLLRSRAALGCPGGTSLLDLDGTVRKKVAKYQKSHPKATFEEIEEHCFKGQDGVVTIAAISPRHFECAATRTCQVLIEDDYSGVMKAGVHYIPIKRDFSNIDEVLKRVADKAYCEEMAERTYQDLVASEKYTYQRFTQEVVDHIQAIKPELVGENRLDTVVGGMLNVRRHLPQVERVRWRLWYLWHISMGKRFAKS